MVEKWGLPAGGFATLTLHRPSNVDEPLIFGEILEALHQVAQEIPIIFPIHPRTRKRVEQFGFGDYFSDTEKPRGLWLTEPLGYLDFLHLNMNALMVITDSSGLQEETTVLGIPCITLRNNTERPVTCEMGTNFVVGNSRDDILRHTFGILSGAVPRGRVPDKWDGRTAERIVDFLRERDLASNKSPKKIIENTF